MEEIKAEKLKSEKKEPASAEITEAKPEKEKRPWSTKKWFAVMALLLVVFFLVPVVNEYIPQKVNVKYVGFDGETTKTYWTRAHRVSGFTSEHKEDIKEEDVITGLVNASILDIKPADIKDGLRSSISDSISAETGAAGGEAVAAEVRRGDSKDAFIANDMTITVVKAEETKAKIGGKRQKINIYPVTVEKALKYNGIDFDEDDVIKPALEETLQSDDIIKITRVQIKTKDKTLEIEPQEKDAVFDNSLASGTIVRSEGEPGKAVYTYTYKYVNGKKVRTKKEFKKWKKKPVDIQLRFGTSETGESGQVSYSETFIGNCTAYYAGKNAHGATGQRCYSGTCAVDPTVIPYGTKLYVEGYGTAIANDCGGAVKGHIIDLYMRSTKECFQWGRRNKKVYVLGS